MSDIESKDRISENISLIERIESEVLGHYLHRNIDELEVGLPYPELPIVEEGDSSKIRHKLRRRGNEAIYELDPYGMRVQIHYSKENGQNLTMFNSNHQDIKSESFGLDKELLKILQNSDIQD